MIWKEEEEEEEEEGMSTSWERQGVARGNTGTALQCPQQRCNSLHLGTVSGYRLLSFPMYPVPVVL